ncbi:portal protein [Serratia phage MQ-4]|nr:portal protein [Serratia phage MQ-4]
MNLKFWKRAAPVAEQANKRQPMRSRLAARMFAAASVDRLSTGWGTNPLTADQIIEKDQRIVVARSREQAANNDYAKSYLRMCRQNIVGPKGVMLQAKSVGNDGKLDKPANDAIETAWEKWGNRKNADVTGKLSWRAIQASCVNTAAKDGEFMLRLIYGAEAGPWGFSLQVLDPQRCPVIMKEDRLPSGGFIRQGIEFNRYGRAIAYYFDSTDETEETYRWGGNNYVRVPAEQIVHGFLEDMVGQKRGLPWMATSLIRMRHMAGMEQAAVINARAGANKLGFIEREHDADELDIDDEEEIIINSEPGEFNILPRGAKVAKFDHQYPNGEYAIFIKSMLRGMASGGGVAYNTLANDLEGVNFSSIRQGALDEREHWKELQEWLIECLCQPVFEAWLPRALLSRKITVNGRSLRPERIDRYSVVEWQGRRWQWIDPSADVKAAVASKNNMLASAGQIIRESGRDPDSVWIEAARDVRAMVNAYVAEGFDEKAATELVMLSMGREPQLQQSSGQADDQNPAQ